MLLSSPLPLTPTPEPALSLTPTDDEIHAEIDWTTIATLSIDPEEDDRRFDAEWAQARERATALKARDMVDALAPDTPELPADDDDEWRPVSAPAGRYRRPAPAPQPPQPAMRSATPTPVSGVQKAKIDAYLRAALAVEQAQPATLFFRTPVFPAVAVQRDNQPPPPLPFVAEIGLDALADAASREAPLPDDDDDELAILADAASREAPLTDDEEEELWSCFEDGSGVAVICSHCLHPFGVNEPQFDAAYKQSMLGLGPVHEYCVSDAYSAYHEEVTGRLPATQCAPIEI